MSTGPLYTICSAVWSPRYTILHIPYIYILWYRNNTYIVDIHIGVYHVTLKTWGARAGTAKQPSRSVAWGLGHCLDAQGLSNYRLSNASMGLLMACYGGLYGRPGGLTKSTDHPSARQPSRSSKTNMSFEYTSKCTVHALCAILNIEHAIYPI